MGRCSETLTAITGDTSRTKCDKGHGVDLKHQNGAGNTKQESLPTITDTDIEFCNGMAHTLDHLMLPRYLEEHGIIGPDEPHHKNHPGKTNSGGSYCTWSPDTDCWNGGWPACCRDTNTPCPDKQPACDSSSPAYCIWGPNYDCYEGGWPACCPNARRRRSLSAQATVCTLPIPDVTKMVGPSVVSITGAQLVPLSNQNVTFNAAGRVPVGVIAKPIKVSGTQECHGVEESVIQVNANQLGPRVPLMTIAATIFVVLAFLVETVIDTVLGNNPTSGNVAGTAPATMTVPTIMEIGIAVRHGVVFLKTGIVDHIFRIVTTITTATIMIKLFVARLFLAPTVDTVLESKNKCFLQYISSNRH